MTLPIPSLVFNDGELTNEAAWYARVFTPINTIYAAQQAQGAWVSYTPTLTATTTNPSIGTGATAVGRYTQIGKLICYYGKIILGTSASAGTGNWVLDLPVTAATTVASPRIGYWTVTQTTAGNGMFVAFAATSTTMQSRYPASWPLGASTVVSNSTGTWASGSELNWQVFYEAA
jgi:hypothetical protein